MRLYAPCVICFKASLDPTGNPRTPIVFSPGRVSDYGFVKVRCSKGHDSVVLFDERKHDILFRSACYAYVAGYDREAVSGFAAALERMYEFFIRVFARHQKIESKVFDSTWKSVSKQSERQLGMFVGYYAMLTGTSYSLDMKMVEFRNRVIHQGYIPDESEVDRFGSYVFDQKLALSKILAERCKEAISIEEEAELETMRKSAPPGVVQFGFKATLVNVDTKTNTAYDITNFGDYLRGIRENPRG